MIKHIFRKMGWGTTELEICMAALDWGIDRKSIMKLLVAGQDNSETRQGNEQNAMSQRRR